MLSLNQIEILDNNIIVKLKEVKDVTKSKIIKSDKVIENEKEENNKKGLEVLLVSSEVTDIKVGDFILLYPDTQMVESTVSDFDYNKNIAIVSRSSIMLKIKN